MSQGQRRWRVTGGPIKFAGGMLYGGYVLSIRRATRMDRPCWLVELLEANGRTLKPGPLTLCTLQTRKPFTEFVERYAREES